MYNNIAPQGVLFIDESTAAKLKLSALCIDKSSAAKLKLSALCVDRKNLSAEALSPTD